MIIISNFESIGTRVLVDYHDLIHPMIFELTMLQGGHTRMVHFKKANYLQFR